MASYRLPPVCKKSKFVTAEIILPFEKIWSFSTEFDW
jgi:hypothetical protein